MLSYKHTEIWEKCIEKHKLQLSASCTSRVFLKIAKCLIYNLKMNEEQVLYLFYNNNV